ncbi:MAG: phosphoenolpyruvate--protein phosphotransferase, partial [Planctomycetaceae bacterium]|nr:phosphoenolpyruvate--protein phosphotransferase [Planctomycetaceae bacterium]
MLIKHGIAVSPGVAIAQALVLGVEDFRIPRQTIDLTEIKEGFDPTDAEAARLKSALNHLCEEIAGNEALAAEHLGKEAAAIFAAHLQLCRDPKLLREIETLIRGANHTAEYASSQVLRRYAKSLQSLGNTYLAERAADIFDLERGLLRHLLGE